MLVWYFLKVSHIIELLLSLANVKGCTGDSIHKLTFIDKYVNFILVISLKGGETEEVKFILMFRNI